MVVITSIYLNILKIQNLKKDFILICSGSSSEKIFNYCLNINEFKQYYIYCFNKEKYQPLFQKYPKLRGIFNDFNDLKKQLSLIPKTKNIIKSSNLIFFNDYNNIYIELHYEIIWKFSLYKLLKSKNFNHSKFLDLVNNKLPYYSDIAKQLLYHDENDMINYFLKNTDENEETIKRIFNCKHDILNYIKSYTLEIFKQIFKRRKFRTIFNVIKSYFKIYISFIWI